MNLRYIENNVLDYELRPGGEIIEDKRFQNYESLPGGKQSSNIGYRLYTILNSDSFAKGSVNSILRGFIRVLNYYNNTEYKDKKSLMEALLAIRSSINLYYNASGNKPIFSKRAKNNSIDTVLQEIIILGDKIFKLQDKINSNEIQELVINSSMILMDLIFLEGFVGGTISHYPSQVKDVISRYNKGFYIFDPKYDLNNIFNNNDSNKTKGTLICLNGNYRGYSWEIKNKIIYITKNSIIVTTIKDSSLNIEKEIDQLIKNFEASNVSYDSIDYKKNKQLFYGKSNKSSKKIQGRKK